MRESNGIAEYYDDLSRFELRRNSLVMHKRLTSSPSVDELLKSRLATSSSRRVLDVGCGFGTTLSALSSLPSIDELHGLTISAVQKDAAERMRTSDKPRFFVASYADPLPATYDAMIAIESLVFAADLEQVICNLSRHLTGGGRLLLVEDMANEHEFSRWEDTYREGFRLTRVYRRTDFETAFANSGLEIEESVDLTPRLALAKKRWAPARAAMLSCLRRLSPSRRWFNIASAYWGGVFLEQLYESDRFSYRFYALRKGGGR